MRQTLIFFLMIPFVHQFGFSQNPVPVWYKDYDTIKFENLKIEYTNDSGNVQILPFRVQDSLLESTLHDQIDSTIEWGGSMVGWFADYGDYVTLLYYSCYAPTHTNFSFARNSICMSQSICFYSYKNVSELAYLGFVNSHFKLIYNDFAISAKTTLEDFSEYFPHSYQSGMDSTKSPYNFNPADPNRLIFLLRINSPEMYLEQISEDAYHFGREDPIRSNCIAFEFKEGKIISVYRQLGT